MIRKIKQLPEKTALVIGIAIILASGLLFPLNNWLGFVLRAVIIGIGFFFILSAADKKHSKKNKDQSKNTLD